MNFWTSGSGAPITGAPDKAFLQDFTVIPNNTMALAAIKSFMIAEENATAYCASASRYYQIIWKISSVDFKGREVKQKIKPFDGKPEQIDRALNMLK